MIDNEDGTFSFVVGIRHFNNKKDVGVMTTDFDGKELNIHSKIKQVVALVKKDLLGAKTVLVRVK